MLLALSIGDKRQLAAWWQDLARLGIVHLLVISGLHIGLVALFGAALGKGLARLVILMSSACSVVGLRLTSPVLHWLAPVSGLLAAGAYSPSGGLLPADSAGANCRSSRGDSKALLSSHSALRLSGMGTDTNCAIAALGGIECRLLAVVFRRGDFNCLVFSLAVNRSLVAEKAHSQCSVGSAGDYVSAPVVFYWATVLAGAAG